MTSRSGHRQEYLELFSRLFDLDLSIGKIGLRCSISLIFANRLLFGSLDDDYRGFFLVAILRAALGKRTVGIFMRPQTCFKSSGLYYKAKKMAFKVLKRVDVISVFTIVPFSIAPEYEVVADAGLIDPQMWDKCDGSSNRADIQLTSRICSAAAGRHVLAFVGTASAIKGIELLRDLMSGTNWPNQEIFVVVAGRFPDELQDVAHALEKRGAMVLARFITDAELFALYNQADFVWACYQPDYDQASGIFGRAIQFSKTPVVRTGSLIALFAKQNDLMSVELDFTSLDIAASLLINSKCDHESNIAPRIASWKKDFTDRVGEAL